MSAITLVIKDDEKSIYSVRIAVARKEKIDSGSMQFHHTRYVMTGQMLVFTDAPCVIAGALIFAKGQEEEVFNNLAEYISHEKELPDDCVLIEEVE